MRRVTLSILLVALLATSCSDDVASPDGSTTNDQTTAPSQDPGIAVAPDVAWIDSVEILLLESYPVQVHAVVKGTMPSPCHELTWEVSDPDPDGRIVMDVWSTIDPNDDCAEVIQDFEESIPVGSFTGGEFVLVVNGDEYPFGI